jgi:spermidine/putrescine transport system ATP-binding protein
VQNANDGKASFATAIGTFEARFAGKKSDTSLKLYVRPEHTILSSKARTENSVAVTVGDVSFEGPFIVVSAVSQNGTHLTAELRNDGLATVPAPGTKMHMSFDAAKAAILPDTSSPGA